MVERRSSGREQCVSHLLEKNNSKWITVLNVKCKTIKHLGKKVEENLQDLELDKKFRDLTMSMIRKRKTDKLDFIKIINFFSVKDIVKKIKR